MTRRALECWKAAGFANAARFDLTGIGDEDGVFSLHFTDPENDSPEWSYRIRIGDTGNVLELSTYPWKRYDSWLEHEQPASPEVPDDVLNRIGEFLKLVNPEVRYEKLIVISQYVYDDAVFIDLAEENWEFEDLELYLTVQLTPDWRIVDYTSVGHG